MLKRIISQHLDQSLLISTYGNNSSKGQAINQTIGGQAINQTIGSILRQEGTLTSIMMFTPLVVTMNWHSSAHASTARIVQTHWTRTEISIFISFWERYQLVWQVKTHMRETCQRYIDAIKSYNA